MTIPIRSHSPRRALTHLTLVVTFFSLTHRGSSVLHPLVVSLEVHTVAISNAEDRVETWAEVGHLKLEFDGPAALITLCENATHSDQQTCPLRDRQCSHAAQGLFRLELDKRSIESVAFLQRKNGLSTSTERLGAFDVMIPFGCRYCYTNCEVCDWAGTEGNYGMSPDTALENLLLQLENYVWKPSPHTLSLAIILSINGHLPPHQESQYNFGDVKLRVLPPNLQHGDSCTAIVSESHTKSSRSEGVWPLSGEFDVEILRTELPTIHPIEYRNELNPLSKEDVHNTRNRRLSMLETSVLGGVKSRTGNPGIVQAFFAPVIPMVISMIPPQVIDAVLPPIKRLVFTGVVDVVTEVHNEMATNPIWTETLNPVTDKVVEETTKEVSERVGKYVYNNIAKLVVPDMVELMTRVVTERTLPLACSTAIGRIAIRTRQILVPVLSKSITHSLVASLSHTLTHSPLQSYYCYYCSKFNEYCEYCSLSTSQSYYAIYHAGYYSSWYALYYGPHGRRAGTKFGGGLKFSTQRHEEYLNELAYRTEKGRKYRPTHRGDKYANDDAQQNYYRLHNSREESKDEYSGHFFFANADRRLGDLY